MSTLFIRRTMLIVFAAVMVLAFAPAPASAQLGIKNEDVDIKFGIQGQFWADWNQSPETGAYAQQFYLLRARLIAGGDIGKDITFFFQTDDPKLGLNPKNLTTGFVIQDAFVEWKVNQAFRIDGGLMLVPYSRQALQATTSYYTLNISPVSTVNNGPTESSALRDAGFGARGYLAKDKFQYRLGFFDGEKNSAGNNSLRTAGYLQYDFFEPEVGYVYKGTSLGKNKILAVDAGFDTQGAYRSMSANVASDTPVNGGDEIGLNAQYIHFDGKNTFLTIPDQNNFLGEAAYYFHKAKFQPFAKFEEQNFVAAVNNTKTIHRAGAGVNYYIHGQNLKWTLQYLRALPQNGSPLKPSNEITMQLQVFYF